MLKFLLGILLNGKLDMAGQIKQNKTKTLFKNEEDLDLITYIK